jgi:hypothetical protein
MQSRKELKDMNSIDQKIKNVEEKMARDMNSPLALVSTQAERSQASLSDIKQVNRRMECVDFSQARVAKENEINFNSLRCIDLDTSQKVQRAESEMLLLSSRLAENESKIRT